MPWRDNLLTASFRGVEFTVEDRDLDGARRLAVHEYPLRDFPYTEDLGRRARRFAVVGFVAGDDYMQRRDALIEACDREGPGEFIDRWGRSLVVLCDSCRVRETIAEGAIARFTLLFVEAGRNLAPAPAPATGPTVRNVADEVATTIAEAFGVIFDAVTGPSFLATSAEATAELAADALDALERRVRDPDLEASAAAARSLQEFRAEIPTLVREPDDLAADVGGLVAALGALATDASFRFDRMLELAAFDEVAPTVRTPTTNRTLEAANRAALVGLVRRSAIIDAAKASTRVAFASRQESEAVRAQLLELLDAELHAATGSDQDEVYLAIQELYASVSQDLARRGATLASVIEYTPPATEPALVTAQRLYGDADREAEIVDRNRIPHPGFVPGGEPLEVLVDA